MGVILNVPASISGILAPNPRMGAKLNHLLCSHCRDSSEIYTLLAKYLSVLRKGQKGIAPFSFSHIFSFCKTIVSLSHFFSSFSMQYMSFSSAFSLPEGYFLFYLAISFQCICKKSLVPQHNQVWTWLIISICSEIKYTVLNFYFSFELYNMK